MRGGRELLDDESGMVTVEAAYVIAAIVVTVVLAVGAVMGVVAQIRCTDAAREVARLTAAGDMSATDIAEDVAGGDARVRISVDGPHIRVEVSTSVTLLPGLRISATAVAAKEPRGQDEVDFAPGVSR